MVEGVGVLELEEDFLVVVLGLMEMREIVMFVGGKAFVWMGRFEDVE